jgi:hypothetical protein
VDSGLDQGRVDHALADTLCLGVVTGSGGLHFDELGSALSVGGDITDEVQRALMQCLFEGARVDGSG